MVTIVTKLYAGPHDPSSLGGEVHGPRGLPALTVSARRDTLAAVTACVHPDRGGSEHDVSALPIAEP